MINLFKKAKARYLPFTCSESLLENFTWTEFKDGASGIWAERALNTKHQGLFTHADHDNQYCVTPLPQIPAD